MHERGAKKQIESLALVKAVRELTWAGYTTTLEQRHWKEGIQQNEASQEPCLE